MASLNNEHKSTFTIPAMDCPAEEAVIRNGLKGIEGIGALEFDLFNRKLTVTHTHADDVAIVAGLKRVGMTPADAADSRNHGACGNAACDEGGERDGAAPAGSPVVSRREVALLGLSGVLAFGAEITGWVSQKEHSWLVLTLSLAAVALGGLPTLRKGLIALRTFTLNINFLMTVAVIGAFSVGEYPEAAVVVFLFAVAELIEAYSLDRARNAVRALMQMAPEVAIVQQPDGSWSEAPVASLGAGTVIRVRPGERLALDGVVVSGNSAVNQAPITGESVPVDKAVGDQVFAGTINESGSLEIRTSGGKDQTTLARIIQTVQEAQGQRAPTQRFVDRFARVYTPIVVVLAILIATVPWLVFHLPFMVWLYKALVLLVIACPCALVISTPVTIVSGLASAARRGILIKGGAYLEGGRSLKVIALDKTGTVTAGKPTLTDVLPLGDRQPNDVLQLAASLDAHSDHPVARAVVMAWKGTVKSVDGFEALAGRGVTGVIDGQTLLLGNHRLAHEHGLCTPEIESQLAKLEGEGKTALVLASTAGAIGLLAVADTARPSSVDAIRQLREGGVRVVMLTGDNQNTADAIGKEVGVDEARGSLLPDDKLKAVDAFIEQHGVDGVGMVGDGINDAPALAKASIGFAMGAAGTDVAIETADVALMTDDLRGVPAFIALSHRTVRVLHQNISLALGIKLVFFGLAIFGIATLWMAVIADMGASLLVVANGMRVLRIKR